MNKGMNENKVGKIGRRKVGWPVQRGRNKERSRLF
jgi:hypothetical protein